MASIQSNIQSNLVRFLDLPPELRIQIYTDLFTTEHDAELSQCPAILRVCKLVYQEAKRIYYQSVTFRFKVPPIGVPLYAYLAKRPFLNLMQNITLDATTLLVSEFHLISYLKFFSNPAVPRSCCTVCLWMRCLTYPHPNTWSEGDLFDSVRKLTAFETVVLRYSHQLLPGGQSMMPKPKAIDEYLSVMLGPGEFNSFDGVSQHRVQCLTYHPRGMKEKKVSK